MITQKSLYEKYEMDLKELQLNCTHKDVSDWMMEYWAPAHSTGFEVRICNVCGTICERKSQYPDIQFIPQP